MRYVPKPTQLSGAAHLAARKRAGVWDEPRVGKTGSTILALDYILARTILIVTTASGRPVWRRAMRDWSPFGRRVRVVTGPTFKLSADDEVVIVSWGAIANPKLHVALSRASWDAAVLDETHVAKNIEAQRTIAVYGEFIDDGLVLLAQNALIANADYVWSLTGTPIPNAPNDLYAMMRALCRERLLANPARGWPDVSTYSAFLKRYCIFRPKKISRWRSIIVVMGGKHEDELAARLEGFAIRRTQADVGITEPVYDILPLMVTPAMLRQAEGNVDRTAVLAAAEKGETRELDMHLGTLRRHTGAMKAEGVATYVNEQFECGLDKVVLVAWHTETLDLLADALAKHGVVRLDGSTPAAKRGALEQAFLTDPNKRVFVGQITAAGEAIDLSAAALLIFVEASFTPKDMKQAALRITNHGQTRQPVVLVAALEGSIDEALQAILLRKWTTIREVFSHAEN